MTGRLFLHAGRPKTGTTLLQLALQDLQLLGLIQLGVSQPRYQFDNQDARLLIEIAHGNVAPRQ